LKVSDPTATQGVSDCILRVREKSKGGKILLNGILEKYDVKEDYEFKCLGRDPSIGFY
jgi:hypothetical protein